MMWGLTNEDFQTIASISTAFGVIVAAFAIKASIKNSKYSVKSDARNMRMQVILHCNARYAELYKMKTEINLGDHIDEGRIQAYFRQYWGLKSDQIDYWLAGYVDPETLTSWLMSTVDAIVKNKTVESTSYIQSWQAIKPDHQHVNPTLTRIIERIISEIYSDDVYQTDTSSPEYQNKKFAKLYLILEEAENNNKFLINLLKSDNMTFPELYEWYTDGKKSEIEHLRRNSKENGSRYEQALPRWKIWRWG